MPSLSPRKFQRQYDDLDLIIASRANLAVGDTAWDAAGIIPPKLNRDGAPRNIFNALEVLEEIDADERKKLQEEAKSTPLVPAGLPNISVHVQARHAGDFKYPTLVELTTKIELDKLSSFQFADLQVRSMPNDLRVRTDRLLDGVKRKQWRKYDMTIRRSFIITELYYGSISISLDRSVVADADIDVVKSLGFSLDTHDASHRVETYKMNVSEVPFAMRLEMTKRFAS